MPPEQIKATLGHEFRHLAHKDTDLVLIVAVGNQIVSACITAFKLAIDLFHLIVGIGTLFIGGSEGLVAGICNVIIY